VSAPFLLLCPPFLDVRPADEERRLLLPHVDRLACCKVTGSEEAEAFGPVAVLDLERLLLPLVTQQGAPGGQQAPDEKSLPSAGCNLSAFSGLQVELLAEKLVEHGWSAYLRVYSPPNVTFLASYHSRLSRLFVRTVISRRKWI
jgi:hypothetical protein